MEALQEFIVKPDVIVSLQSVQSRKYYITGEVYRPGTYPLIVPVTVHRSADECGRIPRICKHEEDYDAAQAEKY